MRTPLSVLLQKKGGYSYNVSPESSIFDAIAKMKQAKVGAMLILTGERLVGIFTERDVLLKVVDSDMDTRKEPVSKVMTKDPFTMSPDMTVGQAMALISEKRFRHIPVVENGTLVGVLSSGDLTRFVVENQKFEITELKKYISQ